MYTTDTTHAHNTCAHNIHDTHAYNTNNPQLTYITHTWCILLTIISQMISITQQQWNVVKTILTQSNTHNSMLIITEIERDNNENNMHNLHLNEAGKVR